MLLISRSLWLIKTKGGGGGGGARTYDERLGLKSFYSCTHTLTQTHTHIHTQSCKHGGLALCSVVNH